MTQRTRALVAQCLHCGGEFKPRKAGHVFCSVGCRHLGERGPNDPPPVDPALIDRLFDPGRDPGERVTLEDWFSPMDTPENVKALYLCDTVAQRRQWYLRLRGMGRI